MILVTLGTQDKSFSRLLDAIVKQIDVGNIKDKVIVQAGCTKYNSNKLEVFDLIERDKLNKLVEQCQLLITHGGVGSILMGLKNNKKVVVVPRLAKYGEHVNDHQLQITQKFADAGYIIPVYDIDKLEEALKKAMKFKPKKYVSNTFNMVRLLEEYIDK